MEMTFELKEMESSSSLKNQLKLHVAPTFVQCRIFINQALKLNLSICKCTAYLKKNSCSFGISVISSNIFV